VIVRFVVIFAVVVCASSVAGAQGLPDPATAKNIDRCHQLLQRTGAKFAVKKLKSLAKCTDGILKCVETKPGVPRCLEQAKERCEEQLRVGAAAEAALVDAVARKCGSDLTRDDLLSPLGLDVESFADDCAARFGVVLSDLTAVGRCLARRHACELERLAAVAAPRAAGLLQAAGVDPAARAALTCLTDHGGSDEHVDDARNVGRPLERCARAIDTTALKLVDASLRGVDRCLGLLFTCLQVKNDAASGPACRSKAEKRCAVEFANLAAAAARPGPALAKACTLVTADVLRAPEGLRVAALDGECTALGAGPPLSLQAYADCLTRRHRCGVAELARAASPRADPLLASLGTSLGALLCPSLAPAPTATAVVATATPTPRTTPTGPTSSATETIAAPTPTGTETPPAPTATPTPGCADDDEPSAFPDAPVDLSGACSGGCTDDGFTLIVNATVDVVGDSDFYVVDVADLVGHNFALQAQLSDIPHGTNYDLFLYRLDGDTWQLLDSSTNNGTGSETVGHSVGGDGASGRYGIEVRGITGATCEQYRLEIEDPS
jgi:hypothetical protein